MLPSQPAPSALLARREEARRALQETALQEARGQLRGLQKDFVYNLQVLEERDRELERYEAALARARGLEEAWQAEASQLKVEVARLKQALAREAERREDLQRLHQRELREHRLALERTHSDKNGDMDQQREQYEKLKWKLERRLQELDGELALQRQELLQEFESELQKRERGFRMQADCMSRAALTQELQVKLLNKELAALREAGAQAAESLQSAQTANLELEERLQHAAQELRGLAAVKDARIKDLEHRLHSVQLTRQKEEEIFRRKHEELDRLAREKDAVLASVKGAHAEQLRALEARVLELQARCEALELQLRRAEWGQTDALREKDAALDKLREEAAALRSGWDAQITQLSRDMTSKDLQVQWLQEEEAKFKAELARCQQDVTRYQQQLTLATEREQSLEREKVQLGLDWQHRCVSVERDHYRKSEELIQGLTAAREQAAAKLREAERKLCDQEVLLKAVTLERDQAVQELKACGPQPEEEAQMPLRHQEEEKSQSFPSSEIQRLQEQNTSLRDAIAQMRTEMEALSEHVCPSAQLGRETTDAQRPDTKAAAAATTPDYVLALKAEIQNLKHKFKTLEEQLEEPSRVFPSNADIQPSVCTSGAATGGAVPTAGTSMGLALRRLGDRAHLLNFLVAQLRQKVLQEPLDESTARRELTREVDRVCLGVLELRTQMAELEKHLRTTPEAGGGPPSQQQPRAPDTLALGREGPADAGPAGTEAPAAQRLQRKLKEAARKILRLRLEKEQLLELGNRLRAEMGRQAEQPHRPLPGRKARNRGEETQAPSDDGLPLGQLQRPRTAQDSKNTKEEHFCESSAKIRPHVAQTVRRIDIQGDCGAGKAGQGQKPHEASTVTCKSTRQKENRSPKAHQAQGFHQDNGHHTQRPSSAASSSLQDTWQLLDLGSSPSGLASQDDAAPEITAPPGAGSFPHPHWNPMAIKGKKMEAQAKPERPSRAHSAKPKGCQRPPKVRNYNFKD